MKRFLTFLICFLVGWQLASSQAFVDHGLNGDISPVLPHQGTVFETNPVHDENTNFKLHVENIPDESPTSAGDVNQLSKPVEENIARNSAQNIDTIDNGAEIPKDTSTRAPLPQLSPQQNLPKEAQPHVAQSVHNIQLVDNVLVSNNPGASRGTTTGAEHLQMSDKTTETPLVAQHTHHILLGDNVYESNRKGTSTSVHAPTQAITPPPIFMLDPIENKSLGTSTSTPAPTQAITPPPIFMLDPSEHKSQGTSTSTPAPTQAITPPPIFMLDHGEHKSQGTSTSTPAPTQAPIFMLDSNQLKSFTKPSKGFQSMTRKSKGDSAAKMSTVQASLNAKQKVSADSGKNNAIITPYSVKGINSPFLKLAQEIEIPPSPVPGLYSDLKARHYKIRRKKRSMDNNYPKYGQADCNENTSIFPNFYIWGIIGWACFVVTLWLLLDEKLSIWKRIVKFFTRKRNQNSEDIESGPHTNPDENKEITIHEKKGRSPSGYGIVKINADCIELIDESYLTEGADKRTPVASPFSTVENMEVILDNVMETNPEYFEVGGFNKRASEKVKVIRRLSSSNGCTSLEDQILLAKEVINDNVADDSKVSEKRKVIREATANERKGSLQEEIEFARSVILPSDVVKELDEDAMHRRQQIKSQTSGRRTSLLEEINVAKEVLGVANEMTP